MNLTTTIEKCLHNDRSAQRELYDSYKDNLYTIAYRITGDFNQSSDLLQETYIEGFKSLKNLKEPKFFYSWIKRILVRKAYSFLKNKKTIVELDEVKTGQTERVDVEYIEQAILTLPLKSRTVFVMYEIEGFSHKEIAETMNISLGTSKSQLSYAKSKLKVQLRPYLEE